jgi:hypothetical protein
VTRESSGPKVQYELRPHKQVERRMLIDALQLLSLAGFPIRDYKYTGMGSFYFVDFILFHKLLGIGRMLSIERSQEHAKRVRFNLPFDCVDIYLGAASEIIPQLDQSLKHILWLDYDYPLEHEILEDARSAASLLTIGSVLLVTVDVEPPGGPEDGPEQWREHFEAEAGIYLPSAPEPGYFSKSNLPRLNIDLLERAVREGVAPRTGIEVSPLFNFLYADKNQMISLGGMLTTADERNRIEASLLPEALYFRGDFTRPPYEIRVPNLTRRERLYLDSKMPCPDGWEPPDFYLKPEDIASYREIYRFFPAYAELLL